MNYEALAERQLQYETDAYLLAIYGDEKEDNPEEEEEADDWLFGEG